VNQEEPLDAGEPPPVPEDWELEHDASNQKSAKRVLRWLVWAVAVAVFAGYVLVVRVHTRLGVAAPAFDKNGREYVWRAWWRARHGIIDVGPGPTVAVAYVSLALIFLALCALAFWVALVPDEPTKRPMLPPADSEP
jgi:hypothetical protein